MSWLHTGNGFISNLMAMSGFQEEYLKIGAPTGMADGSGSRHADGPGSLMNHGAGRLSTSGDGIGVQDSAGTGYRPPCGDLAGFTGTGDMIMSDGHLSATWDILESWSTTSIMEITEESIILIDHVHSLSFIRIS